MKKFIVTPLAADGKIAIGLPATGVRVRMIGTELSCTLPILAGQEYWQVVEDAKASVQVDYDERLAFQTPDSLVSIKHVPSDS